MKRRKPFQATGASKKRLEAEGWCVWVVESRIPHTFITRDAFGFADLLAFAPSHGTMLVQVTGGTSTSNFHKRVAKVKSCPAAGLWLATGHNRIQVHSWEKLADTKDRALRILEITKGIE